MKNCILGLLCLMFVSCGPKYIAVSGYAQGGTYTVKLNVQGVKVAHEQIKYSIDSILNRIDTTLSGYNKKSQLTRFNEGKRFRPDDIFLDIYERSYELYQETDGMLDVASGPLFDLWGFGFSSDSLPSADAVKAVQLSCGMKRLKSDMRDALDSEGYLCSADLLLDSEDKSVLPKLNFNAIAQGYSSDLVASYLHSIGVKDMLVNIGEIYCEGLNPSGMGWTIAVDRPVDGNDTPGEDIDGVWNSEGASAGVVTSGNYRKFYIRDGKKYAHTIDPVTGYPVDHNLLSATVIADDSATADAYATYCMVIGLEASKSFVCGRPDLEAYLIYDGEDGMSEWSSPGFKLME